MITRDLKTFISTITIDNDLESIFSKSPDILDQLKQDIVAEGKLNSEPFYINKRPDGTEVLLDGHTRRQACLNQIDYIKDNAKVVLEVLELPTKLDEELWIRTHQIKRRNLSNTQSNENKLAIGRLYGQTKKERGGNYGNQYTGGLPSATRSTSQNIGKEFGLGESTIRKYAKFDNYINEMVGNLKEKGFGNTNSDHIKQDIETKFINGDINGTTLESMSKVSGSPLHKDKVKKALESSNTNSTWKELNSKPLPPPSPSPSPSPSPTPFPSPTINKPPQKIKEKSCDSKDSKRYFDDSYIDSEQVSNIELLNQGIKSLMDQPALNPDGKTPSDVAFFFYQLSQYKDNYFLNNRKAYHTIQKG